MIRNIRSAMLLAIVAAIVGHEAAAGGLARAAGTTETSGRPAPPAADPEIRHSVLMAGRPDRPAYGPAV